MKRIIPIIVLLFAISTAIIVPPSTTNNTRLRVSATERQQPPPPIIRKYPKANPVVVPSYPELAAMAAVVVPEPVTPTPAPAPIVQSPVIVTGSAGYTGTSGYSGTGDADLDWIVAHESSGNPYAMNSIGACGLFQSLPCSKVLSSCGSLSDINCQIEWGRNYCISRYGSTANAKAFWQVHNWY